MNFKRKRSKAQRGGCLLCKPHKIMGNSRQALNPQAVRQNESTYNQLVELAE